MSFYEDFFYNSEGGSGSIFEILDPGDMFGTRSAAIAEQANRDNVNAALASIRSGTEYALSDYDISVDQFRDALTSYQEGFGGSMDEIDAIGDYAKLAAGDRHEQQVGSIDDSLISSGRFGTSAREMQQGGERNRYSDDVAAINAGLGSMRSNIRMRGLNQAASLMQGLGGAYERRGNVQQQGGQALAAARMQVQYEAPEGMSAADFSNMAAGLSELFSGSGGASSSSYTDPDAMLS